jgi:predicted ATPase
MSRKKSGTAGPFIKTVELAHEFIERPGAYPYNIPAVKALNRLEIHPKVTFLIGENGSGKSTILEALAVACGMNAEGGSQNFSFCTRASHSGLHECLRIGRTFAMPQLKYFLRAETFYNVATEIEHLGVGGYGGSLHERSHGESFFALVQNRFEDCGLYFMDEPESALSPGRQVQFLGLMHNLCLRGSQFVIATHAPIIMSYPEAKMYLLDSQGIQETTYKQTDHYLDTRGFLNNPDAMLSIITGGSACKSD